MSLQNDEEVQDQKLSPWIHLGLGLGIIAAIHPLEYSKVLVQLGYEPIKAVPGHSLFGKPIMALPNLFTYAGYIHEVDGFFGCFRGLSPKLVGLISSGVLRQHIANKMDVQAIDDRRDDDLLTDEEL